MTYPLFNWLQNRAAGVLLHPTSLPGELGIGGMGLEARQYLGFLKDAGISHWQICPLGPTGFGDSPYQCFSAFAGNPYLVDLRALVTYGLLNDSELDGLRALPQDHVDFGGVYERFWPAMRKAYERFRERKLTFVPNCGLYQDFKQQNAGWLDSYALFMALKDHFGGKPWPLWDGDCGDFKTARKSPLAKKVADATEAYRFAQYLFFGQWQLLKEAAHKAGIKIVGDVPIFTAFDGADVWAHPQFFELDKRRRAKAVAGVPPDYFAPKGQLWGNPLFDWAALKDEGYQWWLDRLEANFRLFDIIRIDHFRGFESFWRVPAGAPDARKGKWTPGPGVDFFKAVKARFPEARLIAEDLGLITPEVRELLHQTGLPGMAVLQFAFGDGADNAYLPHNHNPNLAIYPGTHDNDTTLGWYRSSPDNVRDHVRRYLGVSGEAPGWDFLRSAYTSVARLAIMPMQDLLNLGTEARLNMPGQAAGNWQWRMNLRQLDDVHANSAEYLRDLGRIYGRWKESPSPSD